MGLVIVQSIVHGFISEFSTSLRTLCMLDGTKLAFGCYVLCCCFDRALVLSTCLRRKLCVS